MVLTAWLISLFKASKFCTTALDHETLLSGLPSLPKEITHQQVVEDTQPLVHSVTYIKFKSIAPSWVTIAFMFLLLMLI